ncbi:MAG TPA: hypothetical protein VFF81_01775 [Noviherbaspirillum sp.]|nr:hypothetical protein [Noviherbaspirillum sp.]
MTSKTQKTASDLAAEITSPATYLASIFDLMASAVEGAGSLDSNRRQKELGNLFTLIDCADRYVERIADLCKEARKEGGQ